MPDEGLVEEHLWGVEEAAVRGLVNVLQRRDGVVALPDIVLRGKSKVS